MNKIICGDAIEELKKLPEKSINMVMTSPPYWALRDYGTDVETVWDEDENCEHDWEIGKVAGDRVCTLTRPLFVQEASLLHH